MADNPVWFEPLNGQLLAVRIERTRNGKCWPSHSCEASMARGADMFYRREDDTWNLSLSLMDDASLDIFRCPWCGLYLCDFNADTYDALNPPPDTVPPAVAGPQGRTDTLSGQNLSARAAPVP